MKYLGLAKWLAAAFALCACMHAFAQAKTANAEQRIALRGGQQVQLRVAPGFVLTPVVEGLQRPRFMTTSPDGRIFVGDMHDMGDNNRGSVYVLDGWNAETGRVARVTRWATALRNPHSIAFHTDAQGRSWLYLALTDSLLRYPYRHGEVAPSGQPQLIARFPDTGLSAANGGWHLTRTVLAAPNGKLYVSVGSSCNACIEKEATRAVVLEMNPDGSGSRIFARGLRNAVGLLWQDGRLVATNQGADHLGADAPDDNMFVLQAGTDYGWPHCYTRNGRVMADAKYPRKSGCGAVPKPLSFFPAHASALGLAWFGGSENPTLRDRYVVALHGSGSPRLGRGYRLASVLRDGRPGPVLVDGFLRNGRVQGRPCGVLRVGADKLLFTDDKSGIVYYLRPAR